MRFPAESLRLRLSRGEATLGSWLSFGYTPVCEMMAGMGFDWLAIDMEHTAIDFGQMLQLIQVIDLLDVAPLVRVGANDPLLIKRALDAGAHGVIVPMVNSAEEASRAVAAARYPPAGNRGVGLSRAQGYGAEFPGYKAWADDNTLVIVQIEHIEGVRHLNEILAVPGLDGFMVGPYDLSGSLGYPGQFDHPDVRNALNQVQEIIRQGGACGGYHVVHSNHDELQRRIKEGYRFIAYGDDMVFLAEKLKEEGGFVAETRKDLLRNPTI